MLGLVGVPMAATRPVLVLGMAVVMMVMRIAPMTGMAVTMMVAEMLVRQLGMEGAPDGRHLAALSAGQFRQFPIIEDENGVGCDLGVRVPLPHLPGETHQARRIFGSDFGEIFRRGAHLDETSILERHRVAVVEDGRPVELERELKPPMRGEQRLAAGSRMVVQPCGVDDPFRLDRGPANDGGCAEHAAPLFASAYHEPVLPIEAQGSWGALASPFCSSSIEMPSGERTNAM